MDSVKYFVLLDEEKRIISVTVNPNGEGSFEFEFPRDFSLEEFHDYKIIDGSLVKDPIVLEKQKKFPDIKERLEALESAVIELASMM